MRDNRYLIDMTKQNYPEGTRVELVKTNKEQAPAVGTKGTVLSVDRKGTVKVKWDTGLTSDVILGEDVISRPTLHEYTVACRIEGRYHVTVKATSLKEAAEMANYAYTEADFGECEDSDMEIIHIQDENNDYKYPPFDDRNS